MQGVSCVLLAEFWEPLAFLPGEYESPTNASCIKLLGVIGWYARCLNRKVSQRKAEHL